jgi:hypothetical protein
MKTYTIQKTAGSSLDDISQNIKHGGKFVIYLYCISIVALTLKKTSQPYFIKSGEDVSKYRTKYTVLSLLFGWWGLPWGPIYTIQGLKANKHSGGGIDITNDVFTKLISSHLDKDRSEYFDQDAVITYEDYELIRKSPKHNQI